MIVEDTQHITFDKTYQVELLDKGDISTYDDIGRYLELEPNPILKTVFKKTYKFRQKKSLTFKLPIKRSTRTGSIEYYPNPDDECFGQAVKNLWITLDLNDTIRKQICKKSVSAYLLGTVLASNGENIKIVHCPSAYRLKSSSFNLDSKEPYFPSSTNLVNGFMGKPTLSVGLTSGTYQIDYLGPEFKKVTLDKDFFSNLVVRISGRFFIPMDPIG